MSPIDSRIARNIRLAHVKQLAQFQPPPPQRIPRETPPPDHLDSVIDWITANPGALKAAQDTRKYLNLDHAC